MMKPLIIDRVKYRCCVVRQLDDSSLPAISGTTYADNPRSHAAAAPRHTAPPPALGSHTNVVRIQRINSFVRKLYRRLQLKLC